MKFIVIADRYADELQDRLNKQNVPKVQGRRRDTKVIQNKKVAKERSVDELKQKYHQVAREILMHRGENDDPIIKKPFDYDAEVRRKENLAKVFMRTKEQIEREKYLQAELKKIDQKLKKEEKEEKNLAKLIGRDIEESKLPPELEKQTKSGRKDGQR